jgi:hypothetical protein
LGLSNAALHTIYKGAILPLMLYEAPVWIEAQKKECNKTVYNRVQRLINIKIAQAFRTTSNEAICTLTGLTPIVIRAEEAAVLYNTMRKNQAHEIQPKDWLHTADMVQITDQEDEHAIQIFTDGSKSEHWVGAGIAIFIENKLEHQLRYTVYNRCSNNQAEKLAIVKALEKLEKIHINDNIPRTVTVHRKQNHTSIPKEH